MKICRNLGENGATNAKIKRYRLRGQFGADTFQPRICRIKRDIIGCVDFQTLADQALRDEPLTRDQARAVLCALRRRTRLDSRCGTARARASLWTAREIMFAAQRAKRHLPGRLRLLFAIESFDGAGAEISLVAARKNRRTRARRRGRGRDAVLYGHRRAWSHGARHRTFGRRHRRNSRRLPKLCHLEICTSLGLIGRAKMFAI